MNLTPDQCVVLRFMSLPPVERREFALSLVGTDGTGLPQFDELMPELVDMGLVEHHHKKPDRGDIVATNGQDEVVVCRLTAKGASLVSMLAPN